jgi:hypothetical protein
MEPDFLRVALSLAATRQSTKRYRLVVLSSCLYAKLRIFSRRVVAMTHFRLAQIEKNGFFAR